MIHTHLVLSGLNNIWENYVKIAEFTSGIGSIFASRKKQNNNKKGVTI